MIFILLLGFAFSADPATKIDSPYLTKGEPQYRAYIEDRMNGVLDKHFPDPAKWMQDPSHVAVVAEGAATLCQAHRWTKKAAYLDRALRHLRAILDREKDIREVDFFAPYPLMLSYIYLEQQGRLDEPTKASFKAFAQKTFNARDPGLFNQAFMRFTGLALAAKTFPDLERARSWKEGAARQWALFEQLKDITENAGNYNRIDLLFLFLFAEEMGKSPCLRDEACRGIFERFLAQLSPAGMIPPYGDSGTGPKADTPAWPIEEAWSSYVAAFERAGAFYKEGRFRWAAERLFTMGLEHEELGEGYHDIEDLFNLSCIEYDLSIRPTRPELGSALLTRRDPKNPLAPDKLILSPSRLPGAPFVLCDLFVRGEHAHEDQHGSVIYFEQGGVPLSFMLGYNNRAPNHANLLMVSGDDSFPHPGPIVPMAWRESALPLKRVGNINPMDEFCGEPRLRRFTDGIVLRVSTPDPAGVELSVCDFRLEGPKGVLPLDGDSPATWSGKPSVSEGPQGQRSVSWKFPRGVSKVEAKALYRGDIDLQEYSTLKYRWRLSGAKDDPRPLILWTMSQGRQNAQFQCQLLPLAPTLEQSAVEPRGGDGHGLMRFSEWFTFDSAAERRLVLTQEGVLVVRDEFHPGKSALGRSVGPIWHLGPRGEPERGVNYFNAKGAPVELLVAFSQAPHRVCDVQTVDVWSITGQKTAFAKEKIVGTAPMIFTSVLIPHAPGLAAKTIAESLVITEEGGTTVVRLRLEKTTLRIVLGPAGEWKVERGG